MWFAHTSHPLLQKAQDGMDVLRQTLKRTAPESDDSLELSEIGGRI